MYKKLALILVAALMTFSVAACSNAKASEPWDGDWKAEGFSATIQDSVITVNFDDGNGTKALYWQGSFQPESPAVKNEIVTSHKDAEATDASLMGSQDDTKVFTSKDGKLTFAMSMMGVEKTVELTK